MRMIAKPTVLVLGAGASIPYGFPSGQQLVEIVHQLLQATIPRDDLYEMMRGRHQPEERWEPGEPEYDRAFMRANPLLAMLFELGYRQAEIDDFRTNLLRSQLNSVDAFLERRPEFVKLGKLCMAYALLQNEKEEQLFHYDAHWYRYLWNSLSSSLEGFEKNRLSIVTYNYDRSLEYFLSQTMQYTFGVTESESWARLRSINFVHLHGLLGFLPMQSKGHGIAYGEEDLDAETLGSMADNIKIIHEGQDESPEYLDAFRLLDDAERVYMLGSGYGTTNMRRLGFHRLSGARAIRGTCIGLSDLSIKSIEQASMNRIKLYRSQGCLDFLQEMPLD